MTVIVKLIFPDGEQDEKKFEHANSCYKDGDMLSIESNGVTASFNWRFVWEVIERSE